MPIPVLAPGSQTPTTPTDPDSSPHSPRPLRGFGVIFLRAGHKPIVFETGGRPSPWAAQLGAQGLDLPPVQVDTRPMPDGDGEVHVASRYGARELFLKLSVEGLSYEECRDRMRALWAMVGDLQPFEMVLRQPEGDERAFHCRYVSGLEGSYTDRDWWGYMRHLPFTALALDPWAYGAEVTETWSITQGAARPLLSDTDPFFDVVLGDSVVAGERVLTNTGDALAYPDFVVTGPGSALQLENVTTGRTFTVTGDVDPSPFTIVSRPGDVDAVDGAGTPLWTRTVVGQRPWPLVRGENLVRVTLTAATSGSSVLARWRPRYRSGH